MTTPSESSDRNTVGVFLINLPTENRSELFIGVVIFDKRPQFRVVRVEIYNFLNYPNPRKPMLGSQKIEKLNFGLFLDQK